MANPEFCLVPGQIHDVAEDTAADLIKAGAAEAIDPEPPKKKPGRKKKETAASKKAAQAETSDG